MPKQNKPEVPDPFQADHSKAVFSDWPAQWSDETPSMWMFRVHWFRSDVDPLPLTDCVVRRLTNEDVEAMRSAEEEWLPLGLPNAFDVAGEGEARREVAFPAPSVPSERPWHDVDGVEMPWFLVVEAPPSPYVDAHMYANRLRMSVEVCLRIVGGKYAFMTDATFFQAGLRGTLKGQYGLVRAERDEVPDDIWLHFTDDLVAPLQTAHAAVLATKDDRIRIALARFRRSRASGGDDALIDNWIGLEALFGDRTGEITYKAAMRIAWYLGADSESRARWFEQSKKSYGARSRIVHGDRPADTQDAREMARDGLRLALLKILTDGQLPDSPAIDLAILS